MTVANPEIRQQLLVLLAADQAEIKHLASLVSGNEDTQRQLELIKPVARNSQKRALEALGLIRKLPAPIAPLIGMDGSEAVLILSVHSYLGTMKKIARMYQAAHKKAPELLASDGIPLLLDRISILTNRHQQYGTTWLEDNTGKIFLVPIDDFERVNERRSVYGLPALTRPSNFGDSKAKALPSDQMEIPDDVFLSNFAFMDTDLVTKARSDATQ